MKKASELLHFTSFFLYYFIVQTFHSYMLSIQNSFQILTGNFDHVPATYFSDNQFTKLLDLDGKIRTHPIIVEYCDSIGVDPTL